MLHDNIDLSRFIVHVHQVEDSCKNRDVRDARRPNPQDHEGTSHEGHRDNFGVREKCKFKKGQQSSRNSNSQSIITPREGRSMPKKGNGGEMQRPKKTVLSLSVRTLESEHRALMLVSIVVRVSIWLETSP